MQKVVFLTIIFFSFLIPALGQETQETVMTVAGRLQIFEVELPCKYRVKLNGNSILETNCEDDTDKYQNFPIPTVLQHFKKGISPFDEVILMQQNMYGNACDGGDLWFLGINRDGTYEKSEAIDFCGGRAPVIKLETDRVVVTLPGGPPNRGKGYIPSETWVYQDGKVKQIATKKKRK